MEKVQIALVGAGNIGQVVHLPVLKSMHDVQVVALVDADKRKARALAERAGIPNSFPTLEALLESPVGRDVVCVDICTPTDTHRPLSLMAMQAGKDVLIEKPIARTAREAKDIVDAANKYDRKAMVGMNNRFRPDMMILKTFIDNSELGKIYYVKSGWLKQQSGHSPWHEKKEKSGGGVFLDLGIVMLDMALWLLDYPTVLSVSASMNHQRTKTVEDSATLFARLEGGVTFTTEVSWTFQREGDFFYCNVFGNDGSAFINPLKVLKNVHGNLVNLTPAKSYTPVGLYKKSYENELRHFINAVKGLSPVVSTVQEAEQRMRLAEAIYQSAAKGKEIVLSKSVSADRKKR